MINLNWLTNNFHADDVFYFIYAEPCTKTKLQSLRKKREKKVFHKKAKKNKFIKSFTIAHSSAFLMKQRAILCCARVHLKEG